MEEKDMNFVTGDNMGLKRSACKKVNFDIDEEYARNTEIWVNKPDIQAVAKALIALHIDTYGE